MHSLILVSTTIIFIALISFFDGARDGMIKRRREVTWLQYHWVKWVAFYPPLLLIWALILNKVGWDHAILSTLILAFVSWVAWQIGARFTGPSYTSWLFTLFGHIIHSKDGKHNEY